MKHGILAAAALASVLLAPLAPHAQQLSPEWERCVNRGNQLDTDLQIGACTAIIQAGTETNDNLGVAFGNRGLAWRRKGDNVKAMADYDQAIKLKPDSVSSYNGRGNIFNDRREWDRAIADFNIAMRLAPNTAIIYNNRGNSWAGKGDYQRAMADYNEALRINPQYANALNGRGATYFDMRQYDLALQDFEAVLRIDPNHPDALSNREKALRAKAGR